MAQSPVNCFAAGLALGAALMAVLPLPYKVSNIAQSPLANQNQTYQPELNVTDNDNLIKCTALGFAGRQHPVPFSKSKWWGCDFPEVGNQAVLVHIPIVEGDLEVMHDEGPTPTKPEAPVKPEL